MEENLLPPDIRILSVSAFNRRVKELLETEIPEVWIRGEISNFRRQSSGHCYFSLKDERSQLSAVIFRGDALGLSVALQDGVQIIAFGSPSLYEPRGNYQLIVRFAIEVGEGRLQLEYERLKRSLAREGLFDPERKKPLPALPRVVGFVTSPTGAAIRDFVSVLRRRRWKGRVILLSAKVQGHEAAGEIAARVQWAQRWGEIELLVVGRGGGSLEDIWPFNEEIVARAIADCSLPVISAVGHEIDFTLSDFAADRRAETPTAAAEIISSSFVALEERLGESVRALRELSTRRIERERGHVELLGSRLSHASPQHMVERSSLRLDDLENRLRGRLAAGISGRGAALQEANARLQAISPRNRLRLAKADLQAGEVRFERAAEVAVAGVNDRLGQLSKRLKNASPKQILKRGYVLVRNTEGKLISRRREIGDGERLTNEFADGVVDVKVIRTAQGKYSSSNPDV